MEAAVSVGNIIDWNSDLYLRFANERTQPSKDLVARIRDLTPASVMDIGCGPGNSTEVLAHTFPKADITGIDSSEAMIQAARKALPAVRFEVRDARDLEGEYDLIFSSACLQWIPDHDALIPALVDKLHVGGVLAVQVPRNGEEPLFALIKQMAEDPKWNLKNMRPEVPTPAEYMRILGQVCSDFDVWEIQYYHRLANHEALTGWVQSTALRPYLAQLSAEQESMFLAELIDRASELYPPLDNGKVILGFRRLFFTAVK